jgi:hypothetical protein
VEKGKVRSSQKAGYFFVAGAGWLTIALAT